MVDIKTPDGACDSFIAYPDENGAYPAVLFIMDGFGLRENLFDMAKTIASRGYFVLVPNMFYRLGRAPLLDIRFPVRLEDLPEVRKKLMPMFQSYKPELGMRDIKVFLEFLGCQKHAHAGPIGISGYCFGGGMAIRTAALFPDRVNAVASFHGANLATQAPDSPHLLLNKIKAEIYIAHADNDQNMSSQQIEWLTAALEKSGTRYEQELYSGASHGFTMADLPAYNEDACKKHWKKLFDLLERALS